MATDPKAAATAKQFSAISAKQEELSQKVDQLIVLASKQAVELAELRAQFAESAKKRAPTKPAAAAVAAIDPSAIEGSFDAGPSTAPAPKLKSKNAWLGGKIKEDPEFIKKISERYCVNYNDELTKAGNKVVSAVANTMKLITSYSESSVQSQKDAYKNFCDDYAAYKAEFDKSNKTPL